MALTLGDNFSYQGAKPLDARLKYDTLAAMKAVADSTMYDGCMAYCVATDKTYQWKSTNTVDPDTGKWSEYSSGGGHEIKNNGVAVTERGVMNFTGFDIADDSTNEETDVKAHRLTSAEFSDICTPLPGAVSDMPVLFDERETEYVIGWYVFANGTKKPVYEKSIIFNDFSNPIYSGETNSKFIVEHNSNVETYIEYSMYLKNQYTASNIPAGRPIPSTYMYEETITYTPKRNIYVSFSADTLTFTIGSGWLGSNPVPLAIIAKIKYTKNSDTPS